MGQAVPPTGKKLRQEVGPEILSRLWLSRRELEQTPTSPVPHRVMLPGLGDRRPADYTCEVCIPALNGNRLHLPPALVPHHSERTHKATPILGSKTRFHLGAWEICPELDMSRFPPPSCWRKIPAAWRLPASGFNVQRGAECHHEHGGIVSPLGFSQPNGSRSPWSDIPPA